MTHRMFVAMLPSEQARNQLARRLDAPIAALRNQAGPNQSGAQETSPVRWMPLDQWHVTLLFAPAVGEGQLTGLTDGLAHLAARQPGFELAVHGGTAFPGLAKPRHLVALLDDPSAALPHLARACRELATDLGVEHATEPYRPHLTLARVKQARVKQNRSRPVETDWLRNLSTEAWPVTEMVLVRSKLCHQGAEHQVVARFAMGTEEPWSSLPGSPGRRDPHQ